MQNDYRDHVKRRGIALLFVACAVAISGCGSGGSSAPAASPTPVLPPAGSPSIQVLPQTFSFGKVTPQNVAAPLEVTIKNVGNAELRVSSIAFQAPADPTFILSPSAGAKPCASVSPTIAAGDSCTFQVAFQPASTAALSTVLQVHSNDSATPIFSLPITGSSEEVAALTVRVNQLDTVCPVSTAYVSVTDQGGYPVLGLLPGNFSVMQGTLPVTLTSARYIADIYKTIAISAVLDHSGSVTEQPVAFNDMKVGFTGLLAAMRADDIAQVIKFGTDFEVVQPFTSDKSLLAAAIEASFDRGDATRLYDTVFQAVDDTAVNAAYRRAVIVATDGVDAGETGAPLSTKTLNDVIANARIRNVAIFTVGIGTSLDGPGLERMALETGGLYFQANASQNLANVYRQLATLLYERQYVLTFTQPMSGTPGISVPLTVGASFGAITGSGGRPIVLCN